MASFWSYTWLILRFLVTKAIAIGVVIKLLSSASTSFETAVLALLILIYCEVTWLGFLQVSILAETATLGSRRYYRLLELLQDPQHTGMNKDSIDELLSEQEQAAGKKRASYILQ